MRLFGIFCLLSCSILAVAQTQLEARIVDAETKEGLVGAHVYLLKNWKVGATTNLTGNFVLEIQPQDQKDSLIVTYLGYEELLLPVAELPSVILLNSSLQSIEELVVFSTPLIAEEFKFVKIDKLDIYTNPAAKADPILAMNSLPAATTLDESANISLRGSSPIETGVFLNNVPLYDAVRYSQLNGIGTFSIFNTSIVKNVTLFPGNPPLEYGNATSGIISLETDDTIVKGTSQSVMLSLANLSYSRDQKLSAHQSIKLFSNWQPSAAIKALNQESLEDILDFNSADIGAYWYGEKANWKWKVFNYSLTESYAYNYQHPSFNGTFHQNKNRSFTTAAIDRKLNTGSLQFNSALSYSKGKYKYSNAGFGVTKFDYFVGSNYLLNQGSFSFKTGISLDNRRSSVAGDFHEFPYAQNTNHPTVNISGTTQSTSAETFAYLKYFLGEYIALGAGARSNIPQQNQKHHLARQLNVSYSKNEWSIIIGAGSYFKNGLQENTGEEVAIASEQVSVDVKHDGQSVSTSLSLFAKSSDINASKETTKGAEIFASWQVTPKLFTSSSFTFVDAQADEGLQPYDLNYFVKSNLSYSPNSFWTLESTLLARQGVRSSVVSGATFDSSLNVFVPTDFRSDRLPSYFNLSLSLSRYFILSDETSLIAFASLSNVTNHQNVRDLLYSVDYTDSSPALFAQRTGYFGIVISF